MNVGLAFNPAAFARPTNAPTQAQVNAQVATGSGSDFARDRVSNNSQRERSMSHMLGKISAKKVTLKATQVAAKKGA